MTARVRDSDEERAGAAHVEEAIQSVSPRGSSLGMYQAVPVHEAPRAPADLEPVSDLTWGFMSLQQAASCIWSMGVYRPKVPCLLPMQEVLGEDCDRYGMPFSEPLSGWSSDGESVGGTDDEQAEYVYADPRVARPLMRPRLPQALLELPLPVALSVGTVLALRLSWSAVVEGGGKLQAVLRLCCLKVYQSVSLKPAVWYVGIGNSAGSEGCDDLFVPEGLFAEDLLLLGDDTDNDMAAAEAHYDDVSDGDELDTGRRFLPWLRYSWTLLRSTRIGARFLFGDINTRADPGADLSFVYESDSAWSSAAPATYKKVASAQGTDPEVDLSAMCIPATDDKPYPVMSAAPPRIRWPSVLWTWLRRGILPLMPTGSPVDGDSSELDDECTRDLPPCVGVNWRDGVGPVDVVSVYELASESDGENDMAVGTEGGVDGEHSPQLNVPISPEWLITDSRSATPPEWLLLSGVPCGGEVPTVGEDGHMELRRQQPSLFMTFSDFVRSLFGRATPVYGDRLREVEAGRNFLKEMEQESSSRADVLEGDLRDMQDRIAQGEHNSDKGEQTEGSSDDGDCPDAHVTPVALVGAVERVLAWRRGHSGSRAAAGGDDDSGEGLSASLTEEAAPDVYAVPNGVDHVEESVGGHSAGVTAGGKAVILSRVQQAAFADRGWILQKTARLMFGSNSTLFNAAVSDSVHAGEFADDGEDGDDDVHEVSGVWGVAVVLWYALGAAWKWVERVVFATGSGEMPEELKEHLFAQETESAVYATEPPAPRSGYLQSEGDVSHNVGPEYESVSIASAPNEGYHLAELVPSEQFTGVPSDVVQPDASKGAVDRVRALWVAFLCRVSSTGAVLPHESAGYVAEETDMSPLIPPGLDVVTPSVSPFDELPPLEFDAVTDSAAQSLSPSPPVESSAIRNRWPDTDGTGVVISDLVSAIVQVPAGESAEDIVVPETSVKGPVSSVALWVATGVSLVGSIVLRVVRSVASKSNYFLLGIGGVHKSRIALDSEDCFVPEGAVMSSVGMDNAQELPSVVLMGDCGNLVDDTVSRNRFEVLVDIGDELKVLLVAVGVKVAKVMHWEWGSVPGVPSRVPVVEAVSIVAASCAPKLEAAPILGPVPSSGMEGDESKDLFAQKKWILETFCLVCLVVSGILLVGFMGSIMYNSDWSGVLFHMDVVYVGFLGSTSSVMSMLFDMWFAVYLSISSVFNWLAYLVGELLHYVMVVPTVLMSGLSALPAVRVSQLWPPYPSDVVVDAEHGDLTGGVDVAIAAFLESSIRESMASHAAELKASIRAALLSDVEESLQETIRGTEARLSTVDTSLDEVSSSVMAVAASVESVLCSQHSADELQREHVALRDAIFRVEQSVTAVTQSVRGNTRRLVDVEGRGLVVEDSVGPNAQRLGDVEGRMAAVLESLKGSSQRLGSVEHLMTATLKSVEDNTQRLHDVMDRTPVVGDSGEPSAQRLGDVEGRVVTILESLKASSQRLDDVEDLVTATVKSVEVNTQRLDDVVIRAPVVDDSAGSSAERLGDVEDSVIAVLEAIKANSQRLGDVEDLVAVGLSSIAEITECLAAAQEDLGVLANHDRELSSRVNGTRDGLIDIQQYLVRFMATVDDSGDSDSLVSSVDALRTSLSAVREDLDTLSESVDRISVDSSVVGDIEMSTVLKELSAETELAAAGVERLGKLLSEENICIICRFKRP